MDAEAYADLLPWLVFMVIDRRSGLGVAWAAGCAVACAAGLAAWSYWRGRRAPLPWVAMALLAACYVAALASPAWDSSVALSRSIAVLGLGASAFVSLRLTPISEAYTVPLVAPGVPDNPRFRQVNIEMTVALGVGSIVIAGVCALDEFANGSFAFTFMDWVAPLMVGMGTVLWATRRWELFRLSLEGASPADSVASQPARLHQDEPVGLSGGGAVIHQLPARRSSRGLKRGTL